MESGNKKNEFRDKMKIEERKQITEKVLVGGTTIALGAALAGVAIVNNYDYHYDMSKFNIDDTKCEDCIREAGGKESEILDKLNRVTMLNENIRIYKELNNKGNLTDAQKKSLETAKNGIKREMASSMLNKIYLNDIFKEKIKKAYDVDYVKVIYRIPKGEEIINVELYDSIDGVGIPLKKEDMIDEVTSAIKDIVSLQNLEAKNEAYDEKDINEFIRAYENMRGFSNLTLVKKGNEPLSIEETVLVNLQGKYEIVNPANEKDISER